MVGERQYVAAASGNRSFMPFGIQGSPTLFIFALPPEPAQPAEPVKTKRSRR